MSPVRTAGTALTSLLRWGVWRAGFAVAGGLTRTGRLPRGGCVVVANHGSHADAPALLAGLGPGARPRVAAAADYWFARGRRLAGGRAAFCRGAVGGFAVRRSGGGSGDLDAAARLLRAGRAVVVFPEGTRSRDGELGEFRSGAFRLAARTGVPVVPVGLAGTRDLLAPHGDLRRTPVEVRVGAPLPPGAGPEEARAAVAALAARPVGRPDSAVRRRVAALAGRRLGAAVVVAWAVAEALAWPLLPELLLVALVAAAPRTGLRLSLLASAGSVLGGVLAWHLAAGGIAVPAPLTTPRMHAVVAAQVAEAGPAAVRQQPLSGVPFKVYAAAAGREGVPVLPFAAESAVARGTRITVVGLAAAAVAAACARWRRWYPAALVAGVLGFAVGLARVVSAWS